MAASEPTQRFRIRLADTSDASRVAMLGARLFEQSFGAANTPANMQAYLATAFGEQQQRSELARPDSRLWLAEDDTGRDIGYVFLKLERPLPTSAAVAPTRPAELVRLYADRSWHGGGVGAALLDTCVREAAAAGADLLWLGVWQENPRAIAFYEKHGFQRVGEQEFQLGDDRQHDWVMARPLGPC